MRGDEIRQPASVFLSFHVRLVELDAGEAGGGGQPSPLGKGVGVAVESDGVLDSRREPQGQSTCSTADVEGALAFQPLRPEQGEEARREGHATPP
jgi:hypothetical protein